jgi:hypothetical protein
MNGFMGISFATLLLIVLSAGLGAERFRMNNYTWREWVVAAIAYWILAFCVFEFVAFII